VIAIINEPLEPGSLNLFWGLIINIQTTYLGKTILSEQYCDVNETLELFLINNVDKIYPS
jgi:hypothetical protein